MPTSTLPSEDEVKLHRQAASLANSALKYAKSLIKQDASIAEICASVDEHIIQLTSALPMSAGIAFPCCVSTNRMLCHTAPIAEDEKDISISISNGDVVKIELGVHINGFPALVASTLIVSSGENDDEPTVEPSNANLMETAKQALELAASRTRDGVKSCDVASELREFVASRSAHWVEGMLSHGISRNSISHGPNCSDTDEVFAVQVDAQSNRSYRTFQFRKSQVYVLDVALTSRGACGRVQILDQIRPTVYRLVDDINRSYKLKTTRSVVQEMERLSCVSNKKNAKATVGSSQKHITLHLRQLENATRARIALRECIQQSAVELYAPLQVANVMESNANPNAVRFSATVLVGSDGCEFLTLPFD